MKRCGLHPKRMQKWLQKWSRCLSFSEKKENGPGESTIWEEPGWENPFLGYSRIVIEEILRQRGITYGSFRPVVIDTDCPEQHFAEEDDVDQVLKQLEKGLNHLEICTDRPEHFYSWKACMEREYGLLVRLLLKGEYNATSGNVILDFERSGKLGPDDFSRDQVYIPLHKKKWEMEKKTYLDIGVPIGYNMLIVRVEEVESP